MMKRLSLLFFCFPLIAMQSHWNPIISATINNNTGKPIMISIRVKDPENKLSPEKTANILTKIIKAYAQENIEIQIEQK